MSLVVPHFFRVRAQKVGDSPEWHTTLIVSHYEQTQPWDIY